MFNIEGLAKLNKRAAKVFNANALVPPPATAEATWGKKIRMSRSNAHLPLGVAALAEEVGLDLDHADLEQSLTGMDPNSIIESMSRIDHWSLGEMGDT